MKNRISKLMGNRIKPNSTTKFGTANINMLQSIVNLSKDPLYVPVIALNPAFKDALGEISTQLSQLITLRSEAMNALPGQTAAKNRAKEAFVDESLVIMQAVYSYAVSIGDDVLAGRMRTSKSILLYAKTAELISKIEAAIATVEPIVSELASFKVTAAMVTAWQANLASYTVEGQAPTEAINLRKSLNDQIQKLFISVMSNIYNRADTLAVSYAKSNPAFYNLYRRERKLKPVGHISTQLRVTIMDELEQPVKNAQVQISGTTSNAFTDEKGYASISDITFGSHTVTVTTGNISKVFGPFDFKKGQSLTQHFTVAPSFAPAAKTTIEKVEVKS